MPVVRFELLTSLVSGKTPGDFFNDCCDQSEWPFSGEQKIRDGRYEYQTDWSKARMLDFEDDGFPDYNEDGAWIQTVCYDGVIIWSRS